MTPFSLFVFFWNLLIKLFHLFFHFLSYWMDSVYYCIHSSLLYLQCFFFWVCKSSGILRIINCIVRLFLCFIPFYHFLVGFLRIFGCLVCLVLSGLVWISGLNGHSLLLISLDVWYTSKPIYLSILFSSWYQLYIYYIDYYILIIIYWLTYIYYIDYYINVLKWRNKKTNKEWLESVK